MPSNAELQAEVDRLNAENDDLAADNDRLQAALDQATAEPAKTKPTEPSFRLTEGNRQELAQRGHTVSPFTGARLVADVNDKGDVSNVREVDQATYDRVAKEAAKADQPKANGTTFPTAEQ